MTNRECAIYFSGASHRDQKYGESLFILHLADVDDILKDVGYPEDHVLRIAVWLHDVVEDTDIKLDQILMLFGAIVADVVDRVTDEPGANRKERKTATYPKIVGSENSIAMKLADRIANLEHSLDNFSHFGLMYVNEDPEFVARLYSFFYADQRIEKLWMRYAKAIDTIKMRYGYTRHATV